MKKLFEQSELPEETVLKHLPDMTRDRLFERSEAKYTVHRADTEDAETEHFTVTEERPNRLRMAFVSIAACAVLAAGIGGIWVLRSHAPENVLTPGESAGTVAETEGCYALPEGALFPLEQGTTLYFADDAHAPAYYRLFCEQQTGLIDYLSSAPIEYLPNDGNLAVMAGGDSFRMYLEAGGVKSTVTFWQNGKIVQSFPDGSGDVLWWETQEEDFYDKLTGFLTPERFYKTRFSTFEAMKMNDAEVLNLMFGRSAPFGSFEGSLAVVMEAAYAPYLLTIPEENLNTLNTACQEATWRELDGEPQLPDGEATNLYVWDAREPYHLTFYADSTVRYDAGQTVTYYEADDIVNTGLAAALAISDEYAVEHLTWYEPTDNPRVDVWKAMDEAAAQIDLSAYAAAVEPYGGRLATRKEVESPYYIPGEYAHSVFMMLKKTPEEVAEEQAVYAREHGSPRNVQISWNNWYDHVQGTQDYLPEDELRNIETMIEHYYQSDPIDLYPQNPEVWLTCQRGGETIEFVWNNPQMISDGNMPFNCIRFTDTDGNISYYEMPETLFSYVIETLSIPEEMFLWD